MCLTVLLSILVVSSLFSFSFSLLTFSVSLNFWDWCLGFKTRCPSWCHTASLGFLSYGEFLAHSLPSPTKWEPPHLNQRHTHHLINNGKVTLSQLTCPGFKLLTGRWKVSFLCFMLKDPHSEMMWKLPILYHLGPLHSNFCTLAHYFQGLVL